jgi:hypothetical protein
VRFHPKLDLSETVNLENAQNFSQTISLAANSRQLASFLHFVVIFGFISCGASYSPTEKYSYLPDKRPTGSRIGTGDG